MPGSGYRSLRVKLDHTHDDHVCYRISGTHAASLKDLGVYLVVDPITFKGTTVICGYLGYTGHWCIFNPDTGAEIDSVSRSTYETFIKPHKQIGMVPDTEGICVSTKASA